MVHVLKLYFDGACRNGNLKGGTEIAIGVHILFNDIRMDKHEVARLLPYRGTNHTAEWSGLIKALEVAFKYSEWANKRKQKIAITIFGDNKTVIRQCLGMYDCNTSESRAYRKKAKPLIAYLHHDLKNITWIPREENKEADKLSKKPFK